MADHFKTEGGDPDAKREAPHPKYDFFRQVGLLTGIPMLLASGPVCGYFIGHYIDTKWGTDPGFMVLFTIVGGIAGVREMIQLIKKIIKNG